VSRPRPGSEPLHLLVDSTGLKLCGPGEWLAEKHAARTCRSWRKLNIGVDADTGQIIAAELTATMSMTARRSVACLRRLPDRLRRLPAMERTIGTMSTVRSASVIRMRRSLCRNARYSEAAPPPRQHLPLPCCTDRVKPEAELKSYRCLGDANGFRASEIKHAVRDANGDAHLGRSTDIRARAQRVTDHPFVAADRSLRQCRRL
jgi:Transposase DDE domain